MTAKIPQKCANCSPSGVPQRNHRWLIQRQRRVLNRIANQPRP